MNTHIVPSCPAELCCLSTEKQLMRFHLNPSWLRVFLVLSSVAFNIVLVGFIVNFVQVEQATAFPGYILNMDV